MPTIFISCRSVLTIALLAGAAGAKADSIYQVTISPDILPDFYPGGESLTNFTSTEFNATTNPPFAPQWSEIQITFTSTPADLIANQGVVASSLSNMTMEMPQINDYGPVPMGNNLVGCDNISSSTCWGGTVLYISTLEYPGLTQDEMYLQIDDSLQQEWDIYVYFAPGATAIGNATSVDVTYEDDSTGIAGFTDYCGPSLPGCSAVGALVTAPEPASLWFALSGLACFALRQKKRVSS